VCHMAIFLKFMVLLLEMESTETRGFTKKVNRVFMQILFVYIDYNFLLSVITWPLNFVHHLVFIRDTSCGRKLISLVHKYGGRGGICCAFSSIRGAPRIRLKLLQLVLVFNVSETKHFKFHWVHCLHNLG
jgi:hypothetical protein